MDYLSEKKRRFEDIPSDSFAAGGAVSEGSIPNSAMLGNTQPTATESAKTASMPIFLRQKMESAFGADFSGIKMVESRRVADGGADAITLGGGTIGFAPGKLDFNSRSGQELIGHELSHVVSHARGEVTGSGFLGDSKLEAQADSQGAAAAAGQSVYSGPVTPLSASSISSAEGPMQAKKGGKAKKKNDDMQPLMAETPAESEAQSEDREKHPIKNWWNDKVDTVKENYGAFSKDHKKYAKLVWLDMKNDASDLWEKTKGGLSNAGAAAYDGASWLGGKAIDGTKWLGGKTAAAADAIANSGFGKGVKSGAKWLGGKISDGAEWLADTKLGSSAIKGAKWLAGTKPVSAATNGVKWLGNKAANVRDSFVRKHHRAVDEFNNNKDLYYDKDHSRWDRFLWSLKNPLARLTAEDKVADTERRNQERDNENAIVQDLRSRGIYSTDGTEATEFELPEEYQDRDAALESGESIMGKAETAGTISSAGNTASSLFRKTGYDMAISEKAAEKNQLAIDAAKDKLSKLNPSDSSYAAQKENLENTVTAQTKEHDKNIGDSKISDSERAAAGVSSAFSMVQDLTGTVTHINDIRRNYKKGNNLETAGSAVSTGQDIIRLGKDAAETTAYFKNDVGLMKEMGGKFTPIASIAADSLGLVNDVSRLSSAISTGKAMNNKWLGGKKSLTGDEKKDKKYASQALNVAKINQVDSGMSAVANGMRIGSDAAALTAHAPASKALSLGAKALDFVRNHFVVGGMKKSANKGLVNDEVGLETKIDDYVNAHEGTSRKDAKHIIIKSMGFETGKRSEIAHNIVMNRVMTLIKMAESGDENAKEFIDDLGIKSRDGKYSIQGVAEKMGMSNKSSWQSQLKETRDSRKGDPFTEKIMANRTEKEQKKKDKRALRKEYNELFHELYD